MVDPTHVAAVGPAAAILYARILWRSQEDGEWVATRATLAAETGLTPHMIRTAVQVLRDHEWVQTRRVSADDATLVWRPIHAGQADMVDSTPPPGEIHHTPPVDSTISSYETDRELPLVVPIGSAPSKRTKRTKGVAVTFPADFRPTSAHWSLAQSLNVNLSVEGPKFVDHHQARGSKFVNWNAALNTWIRNAATFAAEREARRPQTTDAPPATWTASDGQALQLPPPRTDPFAAGGF